MILKASFVWWHILDSKYLGSQEQLQNLKHHPELGYNKRARYPNNQELPLMYSPDKYFMIFMRPNPILIQLLTIAVYHR